MIYIENLLNISHLKKIQIHLQVLLLLKNTCYNVFKVFLSIIYINMWKIILCESNSISSSLFISKMLGTQNQTLVTIACVHELV